MSDSHRGKWKKGISSPLSQKLLQHGSAACCEDVAPPFRTIGPLLPGLCPPDPLEFQGVRHSRQEKDNRLRKGKAHPHNSGRAETQVANDF